MTKVAVLDSDESTYEPLVTVEVPRPGFGYSFHVELMDSYCSSPDCPCNNAVLKPLALSGREVDEIAEELGRLESVSILVNLETGEARPSAENPSELIVSIAEALNKEIDDDLLEEMRAGYSVSKSRGREEAAWREKDWSSLEFGQTLGWTELFPSDGYFSASSEGFLVADQYCWDPVCQCDQAILTLAERVGEEYVTCAVYRYNLKSKKAELEPTSPPVKRKTKSVFREWLASPGILDILRFRYGYIKEEFGPKLRAERALPRPFAAKAKRVGRNDPCPCGSGKKFKKCCLSS